MAGTRDVKPSTMILGKGVEDLEKPAAVLMEKEEVGDGCCQGHETCDDDSNSFVSSSGAFSSALEHHHFPLPIEHNIDSGVSPWDEQGLLDIQEWFGSLEQDHDVADLSSVLQDTHFKGENCNSDYYSLTTHKNNTTNKNIHDSSANEEVEVEAEGAKSKNATTKTSPSISEGGNKKHLEQQPAPNAKPKRPMSAYNHFFKMKRAELVRQQPDIQFADIGKVIGKAWKALGTQDLKTFERLANRDMVRYRRQIELWRQLRRLRLKGGSTTGHSNDGRVVSVATVEDVNDAKVRAKKGQNDGKEETDVTQRPACRPIYHYDQHDTARCSDRTPTATAASFQFMVKEQKEGSITPPIPFFSWPPDTVATQTSHPAVSPTAAVVSPCSPPPSPFGVHNDFRYHRATPLYSMNSSPPPPSSQHQPFPYYHDRYDSTHLHRFNVAPPLLPLHHHCRPPFASYSSSRTTSTGEVVTPEASPRRRRGSQFSCSSSSTSSSPLDRQRQRAHRGNNVDASFSCLEDAAGARSSSLSSVSPLPFVVPPPAYIHTPSLVSATRQSSCDSGSEDQSTLTTASAIVRSSTSPEQEVLQQLDGREDTQGAWVTKPAAYPGPFFLPNSTQQTGIAYWPPPKGFAHHYYHNQEYGFSSTLHQDNPQYNAGSTTGLNYDPCQYYGGTAGLNQHHPRGNFQVSYKCVRMRKSQVKDYMARFYQQLEEAT